jgi:pyocin large subunit-like protein
VAKIEKASFALGKWLPHFESHGPQMGYTNSIEYLKGAQNLTQGGKDVQQFTRANGDQLFYSAANNEFGVLAKNGNIRTYFQPEDGVQYWLSQIR